MRVSAHSGGIPAEMPAETCWLGRLAERVSAKNYYQALPQGIRVLIFLQNALTLSITISHTLSRKPMSTDNRPFIDFYKVLEVNPNCSSRSLEAAYHSLAKRHHPDHAEDADVGKLTEVINAYKLLKDEIRRAEYDVLYARMTGFVFSAEPDLGEERVAVGDAESHIKILHLLYQKRRENAQDAGVGHYTLQELLNCSDELFQFHVWYLREKGYILTTDKGTLAITIAGVDHVIATSRTVVKEKLMIGQSSILHEGEASEAGASG